MLLPQRGPCGHIQLSRGWRRLLRVNRGLSFDLGPLPFGSADRMILQIPPLLRARGVSGAQVSSSARMGGSSPTAGRKPARSVLQASILLQSPFTFLSERMLIVEGAWGIVSTFSPGAVLHRWLDAPEGRFVKAPALNRFAHLCHAEFSAHLQRGSLIPPCSYHTGHLDVICNGDFFSSKQECDIVPCLDHQIPNQSSNNC